MLLFIVLWSLEVLILVLIHKHLWLALPEILSKHFCSDFVRRGLCASVLFVRLLQGSVLQCPSSGKGMIWVWCLSHFFFFFSPLSDKLWGNLCSQGLDTFLLLVQQGPRRGQGRQVNHAWSVPPDNELCRHGRQSLCLYHEPESSITLWLVIL